MRPLYRVLMIAAVFVCPFALRAQAGPTITLNVDATQAPMKIVHTHMVMPVHAGELTLYYPKWIPGEHA
ncbi:MAG TPA: M61 family peptidase, partial [Terriglobia bacterium]|nr:M61 family peptidase [Terriglobia bacterium]